ncbi:MAG: ABC transporter permease subunit [Alphaproteobacteria bacterium]|nr:ABC transporter permease subunit [Alphaproteobacteria bacterium]
MRLFQPYGSDGATRLLLSVALIALYSCGSLSRVVRIEFLRVVQQPYFRTALAKGLRRRTALWRHGRRHVAITLVAAVVPEAAWVVGGTAVTEVVFAVPGFSQFAVDSVAARDYPVLQAYVVVVAAWMVAVHSAAGLLSLCLDPRLARSA